MMTKDEKEIVQMVYHRFMENEECTWTDLDSNMEMFGWLTDQELIDESKIKIEKCKSGIRCDLDHEQQHCFAPLILESSEYIVKLYDKVKNLHPKNAYILTYFLVMCEMKTIFPINKDSSAV